MLRLVNPSETFLEKMHLEGDLEAEKEVMTKLYWGREFQAEGHPVRKNTST